VPSTTSLLQQNSCTSASTIMAVTMKHRLGYSDHLNASKTAVIVKAYEFCAVYACMCTASHYGVAYYIYD
jgi:hypothetical protein